jgi:hypothetical protein
MVLRNFSNLNDQPKIRFTTLICSFPFLSLRLLKFMTFANKQVFSAYLSFQQRLNESGTLQVAEKFQWRMRPAKN